MLACDIQDSVLCEVGREVNEIIAYSPYGHAQPGEGSLGYNGERPEAGLKCYLLGNGYRALDTVLMRFHSPDNLSPFRGGGLNGYAYVSGNPILHTDPTGHMPLSSLLAKVVARSDTAAASTVKASDKPLALGVAGAKRLPDPTPDYMPDVSPVSGRRSSVDNRVYEEIAPPPVNKKKVALEHYAINQKKRADQKALKAQFKYPGEFKEALKRSKPNQVIGKDAHGYTTLTTNQIIGWDPKFHLDQYKVVVDVPLKTKSVREYR